MAATFSINIKDFREQVLRKVGEQVLPILQARLIEASREQIIFCFMDSLKRTPAFRSISRGSSLSDSHKNDFGAQFGLDDNAQQEAAAALENIVLDSIEFNSLDGSSIRKISGRSGGHFSTLGVATSIGFNISLKRLERNIRSMPEGRYFSINERNGTQIEVPWIDWLLDGGFLAQYRIIFADDEIAQGFKNAQGTSRSGRAVMIPSSTAYEWSVEGDTNFLPGGKNFVRQALEDERWKDCARNILVNNLKAVGNSINVII